MKVVVVIKKFGESKELFNFDSAVGVPRKGETIVIPTGQDYIVSDVVYDFAFNRIVVNVRTKDNLI